MFCKEFRIFERTFLKLTLGNSFYSLNLKGNSKYQNLALQNQDVADKK